MAHLCHDMGIDIEVHDRESHFDCPLEMAWKRTGISPVFEEPVVEIDPLFELSKIGPPPHLSKKFSFIELERFALLKIGTGQDGPDSKTQVGESVTITLGNDKRDFRLNSSFLFWYIEASHFVDLSDSRFSIAVCRLKR